MKILAIRLKNLASLAGPFELDFTAEPLASAGLFAITGPTGAGKSTLLDALCLALFGAVPRLSNASQSAKVPDADGEIGSYDARTLLRRGTGAGYAEVDFVGIDGRRYRARWEANRARDKPTGKLQHSRQSLRDLDSDQLLASQKGEYKTLLEARLGLNFEQFTRAVLLAQSEFSAFLKADDNERSELLEKLTDTALYTRLGKRAFDKSREARELLKQWQDQATGIAPLSAEEREALDLEFQAASQQLKAQQARLKLLEQHQQWHVQGTTLAGEHQAAEDLLHSAQVSWQADADNRLTLQRLDHLAPQRHLFMRQRELRGQLQPLAERIAGHLHQQSRQLSQQAQVDEQLHQAQQTLQHALADQTEAAPKLRQAFDEHTQHTRLEADLEPLRPALAQAEQAHQHSQQALMQSQQQQQASTERLQQIAEQLQRSTDLAGLADAWAAYLPRLQQAVAASNRLNHGRAELPALEERAAKAQADLNQMQAQLTALYQQADCPADQLHERLQQLTQRLQLQRQQQRSLQTLEREWQRREELQQRLEQLRQHQLQISQQREQCTAEGLRLKGEHEQAEQTLTVTLQVLERQRLARTASVEELRGQLQDEQPCPVCGSLEHPYHQPETLLRALSAFDESEERQARATLQKLSERLAELRAELAGLIAQHKQLKTQEEQLLAQQRDGQLEQHPLHSTLLAQGQPGSWLAAELAQVTGQIDSDEQQQTALLTLQQTASGLQRQLQSAQQASQHTEQLLKEQHAHLQSDQARLDDELRDFTGLIPSPILDALRQQATQTFMALEQSVGERLALLDQQGDEQRDFDARARRLDDHQREHVSEASRLHEWQARASALGDQLQACQARLRGLLGAHADAQAWQQHLHEAVETARSAEAQANQQQHTLRTQAVQLSSELNADQQQQTQLEQTLSTLQASIQQWREQHPELNDEALSGLLTIDDQQLSALRARLHNGEKSMEQAQVRVQERAQRLHDHQAQANGIPDAEQLAEEVTALQAQAEQSEHQCAELRARQVEDQRRQTANQDLQQRISEADAQYQRWARLAALIGSAEGDRFRKIAQAYNLDLLVHHANVQLRQLVRRYRLKRGGSMLGLLVLDTEMGDELRSVHSLSGGETFLVSLALALGLASMASSTLRIESLFIDEGFGSLDPESLQLAMDALDGLQAQGRKVAVISHVQEMHERIPVQIQVKRMGNGLSSVEVSG